MRDVEEWGSCRSLLGSLKSVSIWFACSECGVTARRFVGRLLRGSALVGIDSGPGSDIVAVVVLVGYATAVICATWEVCGLFLWMWWPGMGYFGAARVLSPISLLDLCRIV